jgi:hypothetical protein
MGDGMEVSLQALSAAAATLSSHPIDAPKTKRARSRTTKLFSASGSGRRRPPTLGGEPWAASPVLVPAATAPPSRDDSEQSSVCGSMAELVMGAREVRRLIREASVDSLASDFSLGFKLREDLGGSTEHHLDALCGDISRLKDTCGAITERVTTVPTAKMAKTQSDYGLSTSVPPAADVVDPEGSAPDLRLLQWPRRHFWRLSNVPELHDSGNQPSPARSVLDTENGELAWESPNRGWHDLKAAKYKLALTRTSEDDGRSSVFTYDGSDAWEWDCDGMTMSQASVEDHLMLATQSMLNHRQWLPESADSVELDLEAELTSMSGRHKSTPASRFGSRNSSRRSSHDRSYYVSLQRQPPSGRSSVDRGSGDTPKASIDHATLVRSFGVPSASSDESGYQETVGDDHCKTGGVMTLSPVHEVASVCSTPARKAPEEKKKRLFHRHEEEEDTLQVIVQPKKES